MASGMDRPGARPTSASMSSLTCRNFSCLLPLPGCMCAIQLPNPAGLAGQGVMVHLQAVPPAAPQSLCSVSLDLYLPSASLVITS